MRGFVSTKGLVKVQQSSMAFTKTLPSHLSDRKFSIISYDDKTGMKPLIVEGTPEMLLEKVNKHKKLLLE